MSIPRFPLPRDDRSPPLVEPEPEDDELPELDGHYPKDADLDTGFHSWDEPEDTYDE